MLKRTTGEKVFAVFNTIILSLVGILCVIPLINIVALSFSDAEAIAGQSIILWPQGFSLESYSQIASKAEFWTSTWVSIKRLLLAMPVNMGLTILLAYPLSKPDEKFPARTFVAWVMMIMMLISGGLIPGYLVVTGTGLTDSIWSLIIPGAVPAYYVLLLLNFFRGIPVEMEEAAMIDGASHWRILAQIYLPTSTPGLATIALLNGVGHWNDWFSGILYMKKTIHYPLQTYLQATMVASSQITVTSDPKALEAALKMNSSTLQSAQILLSLVPVIIVYPFVQRYFVKGLVVGSVKG